MASIQEQSNFNEMVIEIFNKTVDNVLSTYIGDDLQSIVTFHNTTILTIRPWKMFNPDLIIYLSGMIFSNEVLRNYVLDIFHEFSFRLGNDCFREDIINSFADTAMYCNKGGLSKVENVAIPTELHRFFDTKESIKQKIRTDPWLLVILLLYFTGLKKVTINNENT